MGLRDILRYLHHVHHTRYDKMFHYLWIYVLLMAVGGFLMDTPENILKGLVRIIVEEDALITDYVLLAGPGAALVNAALVTAISICILYLAQDVLNGMTLVEIGLMSGFALFGKNIINIWPILIGSWLYAKAKREPVGSCAGIGLMATALAPIVTYISLDNGWGNPITGTLTGVIIGFLIPPLARYTYRIQNGMNLYNMGFACGLMAMICVPLISSLGAIPTMRYWWSSSYDTEFAILISILCIGLICMGLFFCKMPVWAAWAGYRRLLKTSGRAPSDFLRMFGPAPVMINIGVNGLFGMTFILLVGGDLNGPTVGGILTIMGFSAYGKHLCNILPVMAGVALGGFVMRWGLDDPAVQLACLFCTTLAPISGYFGWPYGVLAGFLHSSVVLYTSSPVAGMNLYNNGFSGGLVAIVLYPTIMAVAQHRKPVFQDEDYFDQLEHDEPVLAPEPHKMTEELEE